MDNKSLKIGIISSIISSIIVIIFINPILSFVWNAIVVLGGTVHQGYVDRIYRNAALTDRNVIGQMTFLAVLAFALIAAQFAMFASINWHLTSSRLMRGIARVFNVWTWLSAGVLTLLLLVLFSIYQGTMEISASFTQ
jgi:hypothetical protein